MNNIGAVSLKLLFTLVALGAAGCSLRFSNTNTNLNTVAATNTTNTNAPATADSDKNQSPDLVNASVNSTRAQTINTNSPSTESSTVNPRPVVPTGWKTFTNNQHHYEFSYPPGWDLEASGGSLADNVRVKDPTGQDGEFRVCFGENKNSWQCNGILAAEKGSATNKTFAMEDRAIELGRLIMDQTIYTDRTTTAGQDDNNPWIIIRRGRNATLPVGWDVFGNIALVTGRNDSFSVLGNIVKTFRVTQSTLSVAEVIGRAPIFDEKRLCILGPYEKTDTMSAFGNRVQSFLVGTDRNKTYEELDQLLIWSDLKPNQTELRCSLNTQGRSICVSNQVYLCGRFDALSAGESGLGDLKNIRYKLTAN